MWQLPQNALWVMAGLYLLTPSLWAWGFLQYLSLLEYLGGGCLWAPFLFGVAKLAKGWVTWLAICDHWRQAKGLERLNPASLSMWVTLTGLDPHFLPYHFNHKLSLSLGNAAAPEGKEEHKTYGTKVITCMVTALRGRGLPTCLPSAAGLGWRSVLAQPAAPLFRQGTLYLLGLLGLCTVCFQMKFTMWH